MSYFCHFSVVRWGVLGGPTQNGFSTCLLRLLLCGSLLAPLSLIADESLPSDHSLIAHESPINRESHHLKSSSTINKKPSFLSGARASEAALAKTMREYYEQHWLELKPRKASHMGLRLGRLYQDARYRYTWLAEIQIMAHRLSDFSRVALEPEALMKHFPLPPLHPTAALTTPESAGLPSAYQEGQHPSADVPQVHKDVPKVHKSEKRSLRDDVSARYPLWRTVFFKVIHDLAWLDNYQLRHENHKALVAFSKSFPFEALIRDPQMIRAWGLHLANEVYWLRQITGQDYRALFIKQFQALYPDQADDTLSEFHYWNKLYIMTHLMIADSDYYQRTIDAEEWQWVLDYYRANLDTILQKGKPDVIAEIGVCFLLANQANDPAVAKIRHYISEAVDKANPMIPSFHSKNFDLSKGEHRNVLAIMLLDWQEPSRFPLPQDMLAMEGYLPQSLTIVPH